MGTREVTEEVRYAAGDHRNPGYHYPGHHSFAVSLARHWSGEAPDSEKRSQWLRRSANKTRARRQRANPSEDQGESPNPRAVARTRRKPPVPALPGPEAIEG